MKVAILSIPTFSMLLLCCSASLAQSVGTNSDGDNDTNYFDTETLRSTIFIVSNEEIHFVPSGSGNDPEIKKTQKFKFDASSQPRVFKRIKEIVGDRLIDIGPSPDVDVKLLRDVVRLFSDPKHKLRFQDLYTIGDGIDGSVDSEVLFPQLPKKLSLLQNAFNEVHLGRQRDTKDSDEFKRSLRNRFSAIFDERQEVQLRKIDDQIAKLKELKARIQDRATRKDKEVDAMLEAFLQEPTKSAP